MAGLAVVPALVFAFGSVATWGQMLQVGRDCVREQTQTEEASGFSFSGAACGLFTGLGVFQMERIVISKVMPMPKPRGGDRPAVKSFRDFARIVGPRGVALYFAVGPAFAAAGAAYGMVE
eukprot:CFRG8383T1